MNIYVITILILIVLFFITTLTALFIRKYERIELTVALYVLFIAISQFMANKLVLFDFGIGDAIVAPAAVIAFPFTFQLTDQINEKFGRKTTHKMILIAFFTQVIAVFFMYLTTVLTPALPPEAFDNETFNSFMFGSMQITGASWIAFLVSENLDAVLFQFFKNLLNDRHLWVRNTVSDVFSLGVDSLIFVPIAFYGIPDFPVWEVILGQLVTKWIFGLVDTPYIYLNKWLLETESNFVKNILSKF